MNDIIDEDIIAGIHRTREIIAEKFNFDVKAIFADAIHRQDENPERFQRPPRKKMQG